MRNEGGKLVDRTGEAHLENLLGWWNGIAGGDIDGDGDVDYLVTNNGLNSKYKASPEFPELLYYGDFDGTGKAHIVEAKCDAEGRLLPRRGFSCSRNAMPFLDSKMKTFHNFASAALGELYADLRLSRSLRLEANTLESGILINNGRAVFKWRALPRIVQIAPSFGVVLEDLDADGDLDAVLAQNSFSPQRETGNMGGGLGQLLLNDGTGSFEAVAPVVSGVEVPRDAKSLSVADLDRDGRPDLVFGINDGAVVSFKRTGGAEALRLRLVGGAGNPAALGARVKIGRHIREVGGGGGYAAQSERTLYFPLPATNAIALVRWPDGSTSEYPVAAGIDELTLTKP